jgi:hypothetical protein
MRTLETPPHTGGEDRRDGKLKAPSEEDTHQVPKTIFSPSFSKLEFQKAETNATKFWAPV